jgi:hypothetical protein
MRRSIYVQALLATLVLFSGCTTTYQWVKQDAAPELELEDSRQCRNAAAKQSDREFELCMAAKGYRMKQKKGWHSPSP